MVQGGAPALGAPRRPATRRRTAAERRSARRAAAAAAEALIARLQAQLARREAPHAEAGRAVLRLAGRTAAGVRGPELAEQETPPPRSRLARAERHPFWMVPVPEDHDLEEHHVGALLADPPAIMQARRWRRLSRALALLMLAFGALAAAQIGALRAPLGAPLQMLRTTLSPCLI